MYHEIQNSLILVARTEPGSDVTSQSEMVKTLIAQADAITLQGRSMISRATRQATLKIIQSVRCRIDHLKPQIDEQIKKRSYTAYLKSQGIRLRKVWSGEDMEPLSDKRLANRLEFALIVIALDNALRGVFYGWSSVEDLLGDDFFPSFIPRTMFGIVPIPPTGHWRGFRTSNARNTGLSDSLTLSTFEYAGVGRQVLSAFPKLMTDMDGLPGPHVLAMSGTSFLPRSSRFHFAQTPVGVLEPPLKVQEAIKKSRVAFIPQVDKEGNLIRVSGSGEQMENNLARLLKNISALPSPANSVLVTELERLKRLGDVDPDQWADRARIILMVNSYSQAEKVTQHLRVSLPSPYNAGVYNLGRSGEDDGNIWMQNQRILRSEVEARASEAQILVAPIGALGRGYNLVSPITRNAAFGSIYFLIRPMTPPHDAHEMVAGINSYLDRLLSDSNLDVWESSTIYDQMRALRRASRREWQILETHQQYRAMSPESKLCLGANTASLIIQSCGRLVRGGVPFNAYFVDAAWVQPEEDDCGEYIAHSSHSLLASAVQVLNSLAATPLGGPLYGSFAHALSNAIGVTFDFEGK
jgi:hypothetical protein